MKQTERRVHPRYLRLKVQDDGGDAILESLFIGIHTSDDETKIVSFSVSDLFQLKNSSAKRDSSSRLINSLTIKAASDFMDDLQVYVFPRHYCLVPTFPFLYRASIHKLVHLDSNVGSDAVLKGISSEPLVEELLLLADIIGWNFASTLFFYDTDFKNGLVSFYFDKERYYSWVEGVLPQILKCPECPRILDLIGLEYTSHPFRIKKRNKHWSFFANFKRDLTSGKAGDMWPRHFEVLPLCIDTRHQLNWFHETSYRIFFKMIVGWGWSPLYLSFTSPTTSLRLLKVYILNK